MIKLLMELNMIRNVSQNYYQPNYNYKKSGNINHITFRNNNKISNILDEDTVGSNDIKTLRRRYNSLLLLELSIIAGLIYAVLSKRGGGNIIKNLSTKSQSFESLKNNPNIPTLDTCKSINKNLKTLLENQVNYIKADSDLITAAGKPEFSNRLLLSGAPGNGKSYFAKIFAKTIDADYKEVKQSDFNSKWAGEGTANFKNIFEGILKTAQKNKDKKYVVCFNELDTIVQPVEVLSNSHGSHGTTLLQHRSVFLNYLDELSEKAQNVIIIGTTNIFPKDQRLDGASLSRFKKIIEVPFPDKECLYEALKEKIKNIKNSETFIKDNDSNLTKLAEELEKRKFSFRNLDAVIDDAKNLYLSDAIKNKNQEFKFDYLKKAKDNFFATDGELRI